MQANPTESDICRRTGQDQCLLFKQSGLVQHGCLESGVPVPHVPGSDSHLDKCCVCEGGANQAGGGASGGGAPGGNWGTAGQMWTPPPATPPAGGSQPPSGNWGTGGGAGGAPPPGNWGTGGPPSNRGSGSGGAGGSMGTSSQGVIG